MAKNLEVILEAKTWLGTPYHHQGRIKGIGVDCGMLLCEVYHAAGHIPFVDPRPYPPDWYMHQMDSKYLDWVREYAEPVSEPLPGDIALFHFGQCISHAAIVVEWPTIIHAYHGQGCILGDATKGKLCSNLAGFWRIKENQL